MGLHGKAYNEADNVAGFGELTLHDLWHCAIKYLRFAGNDNFVNIVCYKAESIVVFAVAGFDSTSERYVVVKKVYDLWKYKLSF